MTGGVEQDDRASGRRVVQGQTIGRSVGADVVEPGGVPAAHPDPAVGVRHPLRGQGADLPPGRRGADVAVERPTGRPGDEVEMGVVDPGQHGAAVEPDDPRAGAGQRPDLVVRADRGDPSAGHRQGGRRPARGSARVGDDGTTEEDEVRFAGRGVGHDRTVRRAAAPRAGPAARGAGAARAFTNTW